MKRAWFTAVALAACSGGPPSAPNAMLGQSIAISLPTDHGELGALPAAGASVTVADFFSPTCAPCKEKVPALFARRAEVQRGGGKLLLVAILADSESTDDARRALAGWGVADAPFLVDSGDASKREAGVRTLPTTIVLDARGTVRWWAPPGATPDDVVAAARAAQ